MGVSAGMGLIWYQHKNLLTQIKSTMYFKMPNVKRPPEGGLSLIAH
jgi:hypothetical protein